ncbi:MAG: ABC transporter ATP-binding protein [Proteobacteria bacterium]|nr:ABC transporter ATP-binding protein [Pseudomonadota bacterium]MBU1714767.1 ABC transporter ATP-binding protein [Pseudomonadota bacterium]
MLIELESVTKIYNQGRANEVKALDRVDLTIRENTMVCLKGASGSGKSTLLSIIGCVFPPTDGRAAIAGKQLSRMPDRFLTIHRRQTIGFIFQQFNILPNLTVLDNITLPLLPLGISPKERRLRAMPLMEKLAITHRENFLAGQISGGELQRVAIARALINNQPIILADEPTAHLDTRLSQQFMATMADLKAGGKTIVIASHDPLITDDSRIDQVIGVKDGRVNVP